MAWSGYFQFDGSEIINSQRVEQYAKNLHLPWFRPVYRTDSLGYMLGDGLAYRTPLLDNAPWMDDDVDESSDFLGLYPLEIVGLENSTRQATIVESTKNGGVVRGVRHGTKTVVFSALLIGLTEDAVDYGQRWLKSILNGAPCDGGDCSGADLCFLSAEPIMELPHPTDGSILMVDSDGYGGPFYAYGEGPYGGAITEVVPPTIKPAPFNGDECLEPLWRSHRSVTTTVGPDITSKRVLSDGSHVWAVTFTMVAGIPYQFGMEKPIISQFLADDTTNPWAEGIVPGTYDANGFIYDEVDCLEPALGPLYDPLCPALIPPPAPADVPMGCYIPPENWVRRQITIPKQNIPLWGEVLPVVRLHARDAEIRALRLRFYADPYDEGDPNLDPCSYCGDLVVSYVPKNYTLVFDAASEAVWVEGPNSVRRADTLVFRTDGKPFDWPALTCGFGYIVTFDTTQTQKPPVIDLSLIPRVI